MSVAPNRGRLVETARMRTATTPRSSTTTRASLIGLRNPLRRSGRQGLHADLISRGARDRRTKRLESVSESQSQGLSRRKTQSAQRRFWLLVPRRAPLVSPINSLGCPTSQHRTIDFHSLLSRLSHPPLRRPSPKISACSTFFQGALPAKAANRRAEPVGAFTPLACEGLSAELCPAVP